MAAAEKSGFSFLQNPHPEEKNRQQDKDNMNDNKMCKSKRPSQCADIVWVAYLSGGHLTHILNLVKHESDSNYFFMKGVMASYRKSSYHQKTSLFK